MSQNSVSAANLQSFLKGCKYPCDKGRILFIAEQNDAPTEILDMLGKLQDQQFSGPAAVQAAAFSGEGGKGNNQQNGSYEFNGNRFGGFDPNPEQVSSKRSGKQDNDPTFQKSKERYEEEGPRTTRRPDDEPDHRLRGNETDALADSRHMRHGYDGRGRVTNPETDSRLSGQETEALYNARHMTRGYDGRGRVRKIGVGKVEQIKDDNNFEGTQRNTPKQPASQGQNNKQLLLDYLEDNSPCDLNALHDFFQANNLSGNAKQMLSELKQSGKIRLTDNGYEFGGEGDDERQSGGQGRVKHPETDGRLKQNREDGPAKGGSNERIKRMIIMFLDEHPDGAKAAEINEFCQDHGIKEPISRYLASLRGEGEIEKDEAGKYCLANEE